MKTIKNWNEFLNEMAISPEESRGNKIKHDEKSNNDIINHLESMIDDGLSSSSPNKNGEILINIYEVLYSGKLSDEIFSVIKSKY